MTERHGLEQDALCLVRKHSLQVAEDLPSNDIAQALGDFETHERAAEAQGLIHEWQRWLTFDELDTFTPEGVQGACSSMAQAAKKAPRM